MKDCQKSYYSHASRCEQCQAHIEQGRVSTTCHQGWQLMIDAMRVMDDPHEGRAYPAQAWVDNIREKYVEWLADNAEAINAESTR